MLVQVDGNLRSTYNPQWIHALSVSSLAAQVSIASSMSALYHKQPMGKTSKTDDSR